MGYTFEQVVNKMTNHERNQWARAGYPGLRKKDIVMLVPYASAAIHQATRR